VAIFSCSHLSAFRNIFFTLSPMMLVSAAWTPALTYNPYQYGGFCGVAGSGGHTQAHIFHAFCRSPSMSVT